ncbi:MAG TPA: VWA domain-containing protein [Gammaproteobacteria bacterium]
MSANLRLEALLIIVSASVLRAAPVSAQDVTVAAPANVGIGAPFEVRWEGGASARDFITVVPANEAEGRYSAYAYATQNPVTLTAPTSPGAFEIRYLGAASPYPTLARQPIAVEPVEATLVAPTALAAGAPFSIEWTGPDNPLDFITIVPAGTPEREYAAYVYTHRGNPATLTAPDASGDYELRYLLGASPYAVIGMLPVTVGGVTAELRVPARVAAGAPIEIDWEGPDNPRDFITIVPAGAPEREYDAYVYTDRGSPATLTAPEVAGDYELRYLTGQTYATLATAALAVDAVTATLDAPPTAPARDVVTVRWQGPANSLDYVVLLPVGSDNNASGNYAYVSRGPELRIATPEEPGDYELRYVTPAERITLGMRPITIAPRPAPGRLSVVDSRTEPTLAGATVAVVLDASGSMLQRLDGERRIDVARAAVTELVADVLPDSVSLALRVFGHREADSCRTDLEIPAAPLDRGAAIAEVASIEAMNLARTPIAESLRLTAADIANRAGPKLIILVTDGEETCDGDPAAVIRELAAAGTDVRVNIVGFAIDELMLQETFAEWAGLGRGKYFNASDGAELAASLRESIEVPYAVHDAGDAIVATGTVNGPAITLDTGSYAVVVQGNPPRRIEDVAVTIEEETSVAVPEN